MSDTDTPTTILAWHFCGATLRDGRPIPPDGEWLKHDGEVIPCESGLHASERIIDALQYAPGWLICRVEVRGDVKFHDNDKLVGRERRILWRVEGKEILRKFARQCALDVAHVWDMPPIVRQYLETGDESLRDAARAAAMAVAWATAREAAWAAAWATAWNTAWDAARDAARAAAWDTAWDAARDVRNERLTRMVEEAHEART